MANAPQGGGTDHAQGAHPVGFGGFDTAAPVSDVPLTNRDQTITNRVQNVDVTAIANDQPNDKDYDDPYPGGKSDKFDPAVPLG